MCICNCPLYFVKEDESSIPGFLPGGQHSCTILPAVAAEDAAVALVRRWITSQLWVPNGQNLISDPQFYLGDLPLNRI